MKVDNSLNVVISYESKKDSKSRFFDILPSFLTDEKPILEQHNQRWTVPRFGEIWREVASIFDGDPDTFDALTSENIAVQSLSLLFMSIILFFCVHVVSNIYCTYHDMIRHGNHLESPEFPICNNYTCIRIQYRLWGNKFKCNSDSLHLTLKWIFLFFNFSPLNMYYWKNNDKLSITR